MSQALLSIQAGESVGYISFGCGTRGLVNWNRDVNKRGIFISCELCVNFNSVLPMSLIVDMLCSLIASLPIRLYLDTLCALVLVMLSAVWMRRRSPSPIVAPVSVCDDHRLSDVMTTEAPSQGSETVTIDHSSSIDSMGPKQEAETEESPDFLTPSSPFVDASGLDLERMIDFVSSLLEDLPTELRSEEYKFPGSWEVQVPNSLKDCALILVSLASKFTKKIAKAELNKSEAFQRLLVSTMNFLPKFSGSWESEALIRALSDDPAQSLLSVYLEILSSLASLETGGEVIAEIDAALAELDGRNFQVHSLVECLSVLAEAGRNSIFVEQGICTRGRYGVTVTDWAKELLGKMSAEETSACLVSLAKIYSEGDTAGRSGCCHQLIDLICLRTVNLIEGREHRNDCIFEVSLVSTFLTALSHLGHPNLRVQSALCKFFAEKIHSATPGIVAAVVYALCRLRHRDDFLFAKVCEWGPGNFSSFRPQEIANLVYGFGQLGYRDEKFLVLLGEHIPSRARLFKPQELSITAYAYSQLGVSVPRLFTAIGEQISVRFSQCSAQAVSNTIYAFGKLNFKCPVLLKVCAREIPARIDELTPQHISNIMFAMGKLSFRDERFLRAVCDHVPNRIGHFLPQNIANTIYATWKLKFRHEVLLKAVAEHLPSRFAECVPQDISNVIFAMGELGYQHAEFYSQVSVFVFGVRGAAHRMSPKDRSFLISSFNRAGLTVPVEFANKKR